MWAGAAPRPPNDGQCGCLAGVSRASRSATQQAVAQSSWPRVPTVWSAAAVAWTLIVIALAPAGSAAGGMTSAPQAIAQPGPPAVSSAPAITPIPVPEVAQRAEQVSTLLHATELLRRSSEDEHIEAELTAAAQWIQRRLAATVQTLAAAPSANALTNLADSWGGMRSRLAAWDDRLTARATLLQQRVAELEVMRATWSDTRTLALESQAPPSVLERIDTTLAAIAAARKSVEERLSHVLSLQDRAVTELVRCDEVLARIAQAGNALAGPLLARDSLPIWSPQARTLISTDLGPRLHDSIRDSVHLIREYFAQQRGPGAFQLLLFLAAVVLVHRARAGARRQAAKDPAGQTATPVFERPISAALVVTLLATIWIYPQPPRILMNVVGLLVLVPVVRVVRLLAAPAVVPTIYALAAFFLVDRVREMCAVVPVLEQWVFVLEMVSGIAFLTLAARSGRFLTDGGTPEVIGWRLLVVWLLRGQLAILVGAVIAGVLGYMRLARLLGGAVLASSYVALLAYAGFRIAEELIVYALRSRGLQRLFVVQRYRPLLQRRIIIVLHWLAAGIWAYLTLHEIGVMTSIEAAAQFALAASYTRGSVSISLGDVAAFALTVTAAFALSSIVRFVLEEDVYPRVGLPRGAPYAVSRLIHYTAILSGFVLAIAALGVDLNRITILAGAFGVGIGIGLQNVVANFVAGLILIMERRIHVGDSVQLGDLQGQVREIGGRASTIRTWDGAEVIVPNSTLTSQQVTNWTLSDRLRRVVVPVGVTYTADPQRVLTILRNVATAHPKALGDPPPLALCTGLGDSRLNFELRVWTAHFEDAESVLSQLTLGVCAALREARIEIPYPQQDVHIRNGAGCVGSDPLEAR